MGSALATFKLGLQGGELREGRIRIRLAIGGARPGRLLEAIAAAVLATRPPALVAIAAPALAAAVALAVVPLVTGRFVHGVPFDDRCPPILPCGQPSPGVERL